MSTVYSGVDFVCIRRASVKQEQSLLGDELLMSKRYPVTLSRPIYSSTGSSVDNNSHTNLLCAAMRMIQINADNETTTNVPA